MTGQQINSLVGDLVAMARAMETLPHVQAENDRLHDMVEGYAKQVQDREITILNLKADIDVLNQRIRDAEVSRDDAEFRFLEAEERTAVAVDFIKTQFGSAGALIQRLEPPRPEPVIEPAAVSPEVAVEGTEQVSAGVTANPTPESGSSFGSPYVQETSALGQSEPLPSTVTSSEPNTQQTTSAVNTVSHSESVISSPQPNGPYTGKLYMRIPGFISRSEWLAGGGTEEAYYWREGQPLPDGFSEAA